MRIQTDRGSTSSPPAWIASRSPPANTTTRSRTRSTRRDRPLRRRTNQSALSLGDGLAVFDDCFSSEVHGSREAGFHSLKRRPPAFVSYAFRGDSFDVPRVDHEEVAIPAYFDRDLRDPQDIGGGHTHTRDAAHAVPGAPP